MKHQGFQVVPCNLSRHGCMIMQLPSISQVDDTIGIMTDDEIRMAAIEFARKNKDCIARKLTDTDTYMPDAMPISAFMAGSPGAGKTEFSKSLIALIENSDQLKRGVIRIDGDDLRSLIPGYTGSNSYLFQGAVSIIVEKIQDYALKQRQTFVLDGTLADYEKAVRNVRRSLDKKRTVYIFYVYQHPEVAWRFTKAREATEGRHIPKPAFISGFLGARSTVACIRKEFGPEVVIFLVKKDFEKHVVETVVNIEPEGAEIDDLLKERYTYSVLDRLL